METIINKYLQIEDFGIKNISVLIRNNNKIETYNFNEKELYDIASITKLFTLKLIEELLNNKILNTKMEIIPNYTVLDAIKMIGHLGIDTKLKESKNKKEFIDNLNTVYIKDLNGGAYTDLGMIKLQFLIEKLCNENYSTIMKKYVFDKYNLKNTMYNPTNFTLLGNGNKQQMPHDPKTRVLNGVSAAAGIFTNIKDLNIVADLLFEGRFFSRDFLKEIFSYEFRDLENRRRTYCGLYLKTENNFKNYVPNTFSEYSFSHQGFTGGIVSFDLKEKKHISILIDAIDEDCLVKSENYFKYFHNLKEELFDYMEEM